MCIRDRPTSSKRSLAIGSHWVRIMQASDSTKLSFYPFRLKKFHNYVCFPLLLALHTLNYFVQFSRCGTGLLETRFKHSTLNAWIRSQEKGWWAQVDSNHRPHDYQSCALASWAMGPFGGDKRDRTVDPLLAKQVLSQLSYTPVSLRGVYPLN